MLIPAVKQLEACAFVESWDAVEGHADLLLRVRCTTAELPDEVRQLERIKRITVYPIADGEDNLTMPNPLPIRAYLFIDTDPEQKEAVRNTILALPETLSCTRVSGKCDLVALLKGETFPELKKAVSRKVQTLDGVLRLKPHYACNIKQL
jgi:DNA-binding Lrp family transcriptional regulator